MLLQARDRGLYTRDHRLRRRRVLARPSARWGRSSARDVAPGPGPAQVRGADLHRDLDLARRRSGWSWPCRRRTGPELRRAVRSEGVEATAIGTFEATGRLRLSYQGEQVGDLSMHFLHDGRPDVVRQGEWPQPGARRRTAAASPALRRSSAPTALLTASCRRYNVAARSGSSASTTTRSRAAASSSRWSACTTTARRRGGGHPGARARGGPGRRLRHQPALRRPRPVRDGRRRHRRGGAQRRRRRRRPDADRHPRQLLLGQHRPTRRCSARWSGPPRRAATWPWRTACRSSAARTA